MYENIAATALGIPIGSIFETAERSVESFEVVTSAVESSFLKSFDDMVRINEYEFRICYPADALED